jgi:hypothetical protein
MTRQEQIEPAPGLFFEPVAQRQNEVEEMRKNGPGGATPRAVSSSALAGSTSRFRPTVRMMLRLVCSLATERDVEVIAPVHDAIMIEAERWTPRRSWSHGLTAMPTRAAR